FSGPRSDPSSDWKVVEEQPLLFRQPITEIRLKPWSIPQIMAGPLDLLCDWWSIKVSAVDPNDPAGGRIAARSHSRVNEFGVLFTAMAGLLNLLAIIDSSYRAGHTEGQ